MLNVCWRLVRFARYLRGRLDFQKYLQVFWHSFKLLYASSRMVELAHDIEDCRRGTSFKGKRSW